MSYCYDRKDALNWLDKESLEELRKQFEKDYKQETLAEKRVKKGLYSWDEDGLDGEDSEIDLWQTNIQDIETRVEDIDKILFEPEKY